MSTRSGRPGLLVLVLASLACPGRAPSEPPDRVDDESNHEPGSTSSGALEPSSDDDSAIAVEPDTTGCEGVCGELHDCLLAEPEPTTSPHQAAALELDCLRQCIESGPALADSRFAACAGAAGCGELLPCMRGAWPAGPSTPIPEPIIEPTGSEGCRLGCERLGQCFGAKPDEIAECARGCEKQLDSDQMKAFGECMEIADCVAMLECMMAFPGAGSSPS